MHLLSLIELSNGSKNPSKKCLDKSTSKRVILRFGTIMLISVKTASISPPYGLQLFVMKGVSSADTSLGDVLNAPWPFCGLNCVVIGLIIVFPKICTWLPGWRGN
jgi:TRAP-type C4-dicarboxylate transport system permease large subunit